MTENGSEKSSSQNKIASPPGISSCLLGLAAVWVGALVLERVAGSFAAFPMALPFLVLGLIVAGIWKRSFLYRALPTINFSIAAMVAILIATMLGTLIIQDAPREQMVMSYGRTIAAVIIGLGLGHIFDSWWFGAFILIFAFALTLVIFKRRMWETPKLGFLGAHLGIVIVIVGGFIGHFFGFKGTMDLFEGSASNKTTSMEITEGGREVRTLPFSIFLDDFQIEHYESEYRFFLYERRGGDIIMAAAYEPRELKAGKKLPGGIEVKVKEIFPDYRITRELAPVPAGQGQPAMALTVEDKDGKDDFTIFASSLTGQPTMYSHDRPALLLVWDDPGTEALAGLSAESGERHLLVAEGAGCPREQVPVDAGNSYPVCGGRLSVKVLAYLPDFVYDMETKSAVSRSDKPNNPALQVETTPQGGTAEAPRWLFSKMPDFSMDGHGGGGDDSLKLNFVFDTGHQPIPAEVIFIGKTRERLDLANGRITARASLPADGAGMPDLGIAAFKLYESAVEKESGANASDEWKNPMVAATLSKGGQSTEVNFISSSDPIEIVAGTAWLGFGLKQEEAKAYRSMVTVLEGDRKVLSKTIAVNDPLTYGGYTFYQSNYRKEDPTYSGLQVVRDPGLPLVWISFVLISAGVLFAAYVRPRLLKKGRQENVA